MATIKYDGILVRASLQDVGDIPRTGPLKESPDVSPQGTSPVVDPKVYFTDSYDQNVAKPVVFSQKNLVYIRGKNISDVDQFGAVAYMYWAKTADLNIPSRWKTNQLLTSNGNNKIDFLLVASGEVVVGEVPFVWDPPTGSANVSYSLIGVIATNDHPDPVPGLRDPLFNYDKWVAKQGGVGTWTVTVQPPPKPTETFSTKGQYNLKNREGEVEFYIATAGIPVGSQVSFKAENGGIEMPVTDVVSDPFKTGTFATLPANWSSPITFHLFLKPDSLPLTGNTVTVYARQQEATLGAAAAGEHRVYDANGPVKMVILAQYTTTINVPVQPPTAKK